MFSASLFVEVATWPGSARLQLPQLHIICQSLIVSRIMYALPAWGGLLSAELKGRINAFLRRLYKYGFMHSLIDIEYLLTTSDRKLFRNMQKCEHCLNHLLPPRKNNVIALWPAGHDVYSSRPSVGGGIVVLGGDNEAPKSEARRAENRGRRPRQASPLPTS